MSTLSILKKQEKKKRAELRSITDQIEKIELARKMPELKRKYEGKFWKYDNGTGPEPENRWPLYSYCRKIIDETRGLFDQFQIPKSKYSIDSSFTHMQQHGLHLCETEITKEEYLAELKKFHKQVDKLSKDFK